MLLKVSFDPSQLPNCPATYSSVLLVICIQPPGAWGLGPAHPAPAPWPTPAWDSCCPLPWGIGGGGPGSFFAATFYFWGLIVGTEGSESRAGPAASGSRQGSGCPALGWLCPLLGTGTQHVPHRGCNSLGITHSLCTRAMDPREGEGHFPTLNRLCVFILYWVPQPEPGCSSEAAEESG